MISGEKKRFILVFLLFFCCLAVDTAMAVIAYPNAVVLTMPDGTKQHIQLYGDEDFHYTKDADGYIVAQKEDGFYYYANFREDGQLEPTENRSGTKLGNRSVNVPEQVLLNAAEKRQLREEALQTNLRQAKLSTTEISQKNLVLLASFSDKAFTYTQSDYDKLLNERGYSVNNATGSVRDYYIDNSCGQFDPDLTVYGPYTLSQSMSYYGKNNAYGDMQPWLMIRDVVQAAYDDGVDLSEYDVDGDGCVDNIFVFYAGYNEAEWGDENTIWPHASSLLLYGCEVGGYKLGSYACSSELKGASGTTICGIGTFCHEYGHTLGLHDLYDTDGTDSGGQSRGVGYLSLMSAGNYNNNSRTPPYLSAEERSMLGWLVPDTFLGDGTYEIPPIYNNKAYKVETGNSGEYFLFENRQKTGWDAYIDGHGMAIYHVDKSNNYVYGYTAASLWEQNMINVNPSHQCYDLLEANGVTADAYGAFYPGTSGSTNFSSKTTPAAKAWSSLPLGIRLSQITETNTMISLVYEEDKEETYLGGLVNKLDGEPIYSAVVYLTPTSEASKGNGLRMLSVVNEETYTTTTNSSGQYVFENIEAGSYQLLCRVEGYLDVLQSITVETGINTYNMTLVTEKEQHYSQSISWCDGSIYRTMGAGGKDFTIAACWSASDLTNYANLKVGEVSVFVGTGNPAVKVSLLLGGKTLAEKSIAASDVEETAYLKVDFMEDSVILNAKEALKVVFTFSNYSSNGYPAGVDNGPRVAGKGDLLYSGSKWTDLYTNSEGKDSYNWMISVDLFEQSDYVAVESFNLEDTVVNIKAGETKYLLATVTPTDAACRSIVWSTSDPSVVEVNTQGMITAVAEGNVVITASCDQGRLKDSCLVHVEASMAQNFTTQTSQHLIYADWADGNALAWKLSWKAQADSVYRDTTLLQSEICLSGLSPGTLYQIDIEAYLNEDLTDKCSARVVTEENHSYPLALNLTGGTFSKGKVLLLDVLNTDTSDEIEVVWKWDGEIISSPLLILEKEGTHLLKAEVTIPKKGTEVIQRKIIVTAE